MVSPEEGLREREQLPTPDAAALRGKRRWASFFQPFSAHMIKEEAERSRYREAVNGLLASGGVAGLLTLAGVYFAPEVEAGGFWVAIQHHLGLVVASMFALLLGFLLPHYRGSRLRHLEGSISVIAAFAAISFLLYLVVLATGSLFQSAFSATFFVVLTVAFSLPQSAAIRLAFVTIVITEATFLVSTDVGHRQHDAVMVILSLFTNFFVIIVRHMLNKVSGKELQSAGTPGN
jgi:hypothetical protein